MLSPTQRYGVYFGALLLLAAIAWLLGPVLAPFVSAGVFAYICVPLVDRLSRRGLPRTAAVVITMLVLIILLSALVLILVPLLHMQTKAVISQIPALNQWLKDDVMPWAATHLNLQLRFDAEFVQQRLTSVMEGGAGWLGGIVASLTSSGLALIGFLGSLALFPVVLFYFLRDWRGILRTLEDLLPLRMRPEVLAIAREVDGVLGQWLRGQLSVMGSLAAYYAIALWA